MTTPSEPEVRPDPAVAVEDDIVMPPFHDLEGAPDVPVEAPQELLALKSGAAFVCARPNGDIRPGRASGEGLYFHDTRHLSELIVTVGGLPPPLSSVMESGHYAVIDAPNPHSGTTSSSQVHAPVTRPERAHDPFRCGDAPSAD